MLNKSVIKVNQEEIPQGLVNEVRYLQFEVMKEEPQFLLMYSSGIEYCMLDLRDLSEIGRGRVKTFLEKVKVRRIPCVDIAYDQAIAQKWFGVSINVEG